MTLLTLASNSVHLWWRELVPGVKPDVSVLCPAEREKAGRFHFERDRLVYLTTREMQRCLLSRYAPVKPADWVFRVNAFGRPQIATPDLGKPLHFNLSHTHQYIVCIISQFPLAGVDIESRFPDDIVGIASEFFTESEQSWLQAAANESESRYRFLTLWTLKEAWIKALGTGLSTPLDSFSVVPDEAGKVVLQTEQESQPERWWFYHGQLQDTTRQADTTTQADQRLTSTQLAIAVKANAEYNGMTFTPEVRLFHFQ